MSPTGTSRAVPMAASEIKAFWGLTHPLTTSLLLRGTNKEDWKKKQQKTGARDAQSSRFFCILTSTECPITAANLLRRIYIWGFGAVWIQTEEPVTVRAAKRQHQPWISFPHHLSPPTLLTVFHTFRRTHELLWEDFHLPFGGAPLTRETAVNKNNTQKIHHSALHVHVLIKKKGLFSLLFRKATCLRAIME